MHFSKAYLQLLLTLPEELRTNAIEYRQLKKLINELVTELESLGLSPLLLLQLLQSAETQVSCDDSVGTSRGRGERRTRGAMLSELDGDHENLLLPASVSPASPLLPATIVYELADESKSGDIVTQLRLWVGSDAESSTTTVEALDFIHHQGHRTDAPASMSSSRHFTATLGRDVISLGEDELPPSPEDVVMSSPGYHHLGKDLLWSLQDRTMMKSRSSWRAVETDDHATLSTKDDPSIATTGSTQQLVIPLASDTAFFRLLTTALTSMSTALDQSHKNFTSSIQSLSAVVASTSRPASAKGKSDLYTWRAIFQLYVEAQVFESTLEQDRGERSVEESEDRLALFAHRVGEGGFSLTMSDSRAAFQHFLNLNVQIMNLKKFQRANAEAARKILKKHAKRTSLPLPTSATELIPSLEVGQATAQVPHILVTTLTETLMPVVPSIDDYICLICVALAFKPIRLRCGHLFCVRCLVKMQKQGQDNCPLCRAPTVIIANKSNVDYALINFMHDWFPKETKEKAKANERESAKEEMEELGFDTRCTVM